MKKFVPKTALIVTTFAVGFVGVVRGTDNPFAQAEATVARAKQQELAANDAFDSREMAHAATREIARAERARAKDALEKLRSAEVAFKAATDGGKPEAEIAALRTAVQDRTTTLHAAVDRLIQDSLASSKASREVLAEEKLIRETVAGVRKTERELLERKAQSVEEAKAANADEMRRAVHELDALVALENEQWPNERKDLAKEFAEQAGDSAKLARDLAVAETDAARKVKLEQFADAQAKSAAEAGQLGTDALAEMAAAGAKLPPLRMAALGGLPLLAPEQWDYEKARHLLVRAGFGGTPQEVEKLHAMGLYKAVDYLVEFGRQPALASNFDPLPPTRMDPIEARLTLRFLQTRVAGPRQATERGQIGKLRQAWLQRMVESPRPLQEKLALFWHGLFASQESVVANSYTMARQNQLFREHAAGNYGALLYGIVHDPAMIRYLDNNQNVKGKPNENLAREIMELFSMGVDQGYTEKDIIEAARALTGYNYDDTTGSFRYFHDKHDATDKAIFGQTGPWTGDDLVRLILEKPETSRFIARRIFEAFAYLDPDKATVERLAAVLRRRQYDIEPMLKNLFLSEEFYSPRAMGNQIKNPVELVVGLLRDLGVKQVASYDAIDKATQEMGMQLLEPPDVKGWRYGRSWISSQRLFVRYNSVADLIKSVSYSGKRGADVLALLEAGGCKTSTDAVDYLARACLQRPLSEGKRARLLAHLGELPPCGEWAKQRAAINDKLRDLLVLMLSEPEYQMS
jgi:hypothetical protein